MSNYIAVDLGAESGRIIVGTLDQGYLGLEEIYRFQNGPVNYAQSLRWDIDRIWREILHGIKLACSRFSDIDSIGVNTWGVDYVLLDSQGQPLGLPYHYRDARTEHIEEEVFAIVPSDELYYLTGIQTMPLNTLFQLVAFRKEYPVMFQKIHRILYMPDFINYKFTGHMANEYTIASTSQLLDMRKGDYSDRLLEALSIPRQIFPPLSAPGTLLGTLRSECARECKCGAIPVVAVASHDTASAVASIPAERSLNWAYLSSGTWSLMGIESSHVIINNKTMELQLTNEGGYNNTIRLLKNMAGLWLAPTIMRNFLRWPQSQNHFLPSSIRRTGLFSILARWINASESIWPAQDRVTITTTLRSFGLFWRGWRFVTVSFSINSKTYRVKKLMCCISSVAVREMSY